MRVSASLADKSSISTTKKNDFNLFNLFLLSSRIIEAVSHSSGFNVI